MDIIDKIREEVRFHTLKTDSNYISKQELDFILLRVGISIENEKSRKLRESIKDLNKKIDNINQNGILINKNSNTDGLFLGLTIKS